jgi:hypothetical protein
MRNAVMMLLAGTITVVFATTSALAGSRASHPTKVASATKSEASKCNRCPTSGRCM